MKKIMMFLTLLPFLAPESAIAESPEPTVHLNSWLKRARKKAQLIRRQASPVGKTQNEKALSRKGGLFLVDLGPTGKPFKVSEVTERKETYE